MPAINVCIFMNSDSIDMPKMDIPEKWLKPTNNIVGRFERLSPTLVGGYTESIGEDNSGPSRIRTNDPRHVKAVS
jgi:hypothetical protein